MTVRKAIVASILLAILAALSPLATSPASAEAFDGDDVIEWITVFGEPTDTPPAPPSTGYNWCVHLLDRMATLADDYQNGVDRMKSEGSVFWWAQIAQGAPRVSALEFARLDYIMSGCDKFKGLPTIGMW